MIHSPKILLVGSPHGNERLGPRLQRHIARHRPDLLPHVDYICANPKAYRRNIRFIETDLNRSFGVTEPKSYEERRARKIMRCIHDNQYDYVLDIHTTVAKSEQFFLATHFDGAVRRMISASSLQKVVIMPPEIAKCSLIGNVPQAVSIEYEHTFARTAQALAEIMIILENVLQGTVRSQEREVFYVQKKIPLDAPLETTAANFVRSKLGFYPVLLDEGSYGTYRGFAAMRREIMTF